MNDQCDECGCAMIPDQQRRKLPPTERKKARSHRGRGLCSACYSVARKSGTLLDHERRTLDQDTLLAEASILVLERGIRSTAALSEALRMTKDSLTAGLMRAARAGDERAIEIRSHLPWMTDPRRTA